jgi:vancomycin resistance protein YoaR
VKKEIPNMAEAVKRVPWRRVWVWIIPCLIVLGIAFMGFVSYASSYTERVLPGVYVGDVNIGGMSRDDVRVFLESMNDKLIDAGVTLVFSVDGGDQRVHIDPTRVSADNFIELIRMDVERETDRMIAYKKEGNVLVRGWSAVLVRIVRPHLELMSVTLDTDQFIETVSEQLGPYTTFPREPGVAMTDTNPLAYDFVSSTTGVTFSYDDIIDKTIASWKVLRVPEIPVVRSVTEPTFTDMDVRAIVDRIPQIVNGGPMVLTYTNTQTKQSSVWTVYPETFAPWLEIQESEQGAVFGLSSASTTAYIEEVIVPDISQNAREARFAIGQNGKVSEFQGAQKGITLDLSATYDVLNSHIINRNWENDFASSTERMAVVTKEVEPAIKTSDVNDLGISEILGTGYSNFSGSPTNRVKNIRHAVEDKLNGLLIAPDEEFSLITALKPFTLEGGYLPELVIKGDEIIPEIAGGLCQVGSTMFRTVMNAGLEVTQRRNHSLVVNYYNDHRNGQPGTDATIYDPAPDFRFKNDTGHYILITTDMNTKTGDLTFTFWGTSDGREGYYTEPVVHRWIATGPEKIIETTKLAPGVRNCQSAHPGAETSFTYVKKLPNGEEVKEVFSSYYRPLPKICLVGVAEEVVCQELPDGSGCAPTEEDVDEGDGANDADPALDQSTPSEDVIILTE